ncbi:GNAT family N-acetyltransferase [Pontixanthobacter sp.]|uniref:GNAT family N-acetyltransferase n=1 Tax=Pontixanthobacter sp. TaxID=2792078 RepID=UPI003C7AB310
MAMIVPLTNVQPDMTEQLLDRAFGPQRHARTAYRIREGAQCLDALSFAALDDDAYLAGTIQLWPVALTGRDRRPHPMIMIGPVAVLPEKQNEGYGKALMVAALGALGLEEAGPALPQVLIGDPDYYGRFFGFASAPTQGWHCPGPYDPARLLVRCDNPAILPAEGMLGPWPINAGDEG